MTRAIVCLVAIVVAGAGAAAQEQEPSASMVDILCEPTSPDRTVDCKTTGTTESIEVGPRGGEEPAPKLGFKTNPWMITGF